VLQCVAVCCRVLQCVAVCMYVGLCPKQCIAVCCSVLQCVVVCCSVLHCIHIYVSHRENDSCLAYEQVISHYGVATMSRMFKNICLFAEYRSLL